jgi:hypothetical protein
MAKRKPQINFQVETPLKLLYDEAREQGHWVPRFCAAGLLLLVEDPQIRARAISRLREWETEFADAGATDIRAFIENAQPVAPPRRTPRTSRANRVPRKRAKQG